MVTKIGLKHKSGHTLAFLIVEENGKFYFSEQCPKCNIFGQLKKETTQNIVSLIPYLA
jgi:hypothetical protein